MSWNIIHQLKIFKETCNNMTPTVADRATKWVHLVGFDHIYSMVAIINYNKMDCCRKIHLSGGVIRLYSKPLLFTFNLWVLRRGQIRDFPDHATLREKGAILTCADKLGVFLSLTICNKANFDPLQ